eukprot:4463611-Pyramimonas_sp.AAC.1
MEPWMLAAALLATTRSSPTRTTQAMCRSDITSIGIGSGGCPTMSDGRSCGTSCLWLNMSIASRRRGRRPRTKTSTTEQ